MFKSQVNVIQTSKNISRTMFIQNLIHDIVYSTVYHVYVLWSFDLLVSNLLIMNGHDEGYYKNES